MLNLITTAGKTNPQYLEKFLWDINKERTAKANRSRAINFKNKCPGLRPNSDKVQAKGLFKK